MCDALGSQREREGVVMHGVKATVIASAVLPVCPSGLASVTMALSCAILAVEPRPRGGTTTRGARHHDTGLDPICARIPWVLWIELRFLPPLTRAALACCLVVLAPLSTDSNYCLTGDTLVCPAGTRQSAPHTVDIYSDVWAGRDGCVASAR